MWYKKSGKDSDVILSSKVVITRNIKGFPFPVKMTSGDKENVLGMLRQAAGKYDMNFIRCDELSDEAREDMYRNCYAEAKFLNSSEGTGFLVGKEDGIAVVINNRNHIEIESIVAGSDVVSAYKKADSLASNFEKDFDIAYTDSLGFLSPDVHTIGTGVQIINTVTIPGIEKTVGALAVLKERLDKYDWQLVQLSSHKGTGTYLIVNAVTLGITEDELIKKSTQVINDLLLLERTCRTNICKKKPGIVEDQYFRSYGLLKYARRMDIAEAMEHINWLRVGQENIKKDKPELGWDKLNKMTHMIRRNYKEAVTPASKSAAFAQARAEGIRSIIEEEV